MLSVPVLVKIDFTLIGHRASETSLLEITQEVLIFSSAVLCGISAWKHPDTRGFLALVSGLFGCMFIRECDALLDNIVHGFWFYPALALAFAAGLFAVNTQETVIPTFAAYLGEKYFTYISIGLLLVVVFSRSFGSGRLWQTVMGADYRATYKSVIQEGLELLGYIHIAYGTVLLFLNGSIHASKEIRTNIK